MTYYFVEKPIRSNSARVKNSLKIVVLAALCRRFRRGGWLVYQNNGILSLPSSASQWRQCVGQLCFCGTCKLVTQAPEQDDWCNMGNAPDKSPTTLLIGDSVGNNFAPMLNDFAAATGRLNVLFSAKWGGACAMACLRLAMTTAKHVSCHRRLYCQNAEHPHHHHGGQLASVLRWV